MSWYAEEYYEYIDSFRGLNAREIMARLKEEQEAAEAAEALKKAALERVRRLRLQKTCIYTYLKHFEAILGMPWSKHDVVYKIGKPLSAVLSSREF